MHLDVSVTDLEHAVVAAAASAPHKPRTSPIPPSGASCSTPPATPSASPPPPGTDPARRTNIARCASTPSNATGTLTSAHDAFWTLARKSTGNGGGLRAQPQSDRPAPSRATSRNGITSCTAASNPPDTSVSPTQTAHPSKPGIETPAGR